MTNIQKHFFLSNKAKSEIKKTTSKYRLLETRMKHGEFDLLDPSQWAFISQCMGSSKGSANWWERAFRNHLGWDRAIAKKGHDLGDMIIPNGRIGSDNVELKITNKKNIKFKNLRLYENIPFYLFVYIENETTYHMFLLRKKDLLNEVEKGLITLTSSQVSGRKTGKSYKQVLKMFLDTFAGKN